MLLCLSGSEPNGMRDVCASHMKAVLVPPHSSWALGKDGCGRALNGRQLPVAGRDTGSTSPHSQSKADDKVRT